MTEEIKKSNFLLNVGEFMIILALSLFIIFIVAAIVNYILL